MVQPIPPDQAEGVVKDCYDNIARAFGATSVPVFFTYIGNFPKYLDYIAEQLVVNIQDPTFKELSREIGDQLLELIQSIEPRQQSKREVVSTGHRQDLRDIYHRNVQIMFIFIALREAVKGWAVAAKKLSDNRTAEPSQQAEKAKIPEEDFIYDLNVVGTKTAALVNENSALANPQEQAIERFSLPEYMLQMRETFEKAQRTERFLVTRVNIERIVLTTLPLLPHLIFSPINVTLELVKDYPYFPDLLHLLCDQFPTLAVQRVMFSGFLLKAKS